MLKIAQCRGIDVELPLQVGIHHLFHLVEQGEVGTGQDAGKRDLGKKRVVRKENEGGRGLTSRGPGWDAEKKYAEGNSPT